MGCQKYRLKISAYLDHELYQPKLKAKIESHLAVCKECQNFLADLRANKLNCRQLAAQISPTSAAWETFEQCTKVRIEKLSKSPPQLYPQTKKHTPPQNLYHWWHSSAIRYAASIMIVITATLLLFIVDFSPEPSDMPTFDLASVELRINNARARRDPIQTEVTHQAIQVTPNIKSNINPIENLSIAKLSQAELDFLKTHGFVVTSSNYNSFVELYRDNHQNQIPSYVTVDTAILGWSHVLSRLRVDMEEEIFSHRLTILTKILREQLLLLHTKVPESCKEASFQALAFIKVASVLLDCDEPWPPDIEQQIAQKVNDELALIYNGRDHREVGILKSNIFDYDIDYNKFKIRWDETQNIQLRNYYLAMEWYSRCIFRSNHTTETQASLLILMATIADNADGIIIWYEMDQLLTALYGQMDDYHLIDYEKTAREIFGNTISPDVLLDKKKITQFARSLDQHRLPRIRSEVGLKKGLRIFGGRYYERDFILQEFCYPYVGDENDPRVIPSLLDIGVIIGHPRAYDLATERDYFRFLSYRTKIEAYRNDLEQKIVLIPKPWERGGMVNDTWTYRPLVLEEGRGYPAFCYNEAWQSRKLNSMLCGVVNLPNSQPTFVSTPVDKFQGYVDPYPEFFNRLRTTIRNLEKLLIMAGYPMNRKPGQEILDYKKALHGVVTVSTKMLQGESLSEEDQNILGNFVLSWQGDYNEANISELSTMFHRNHTNYDHYFHAGIEPAREIWVVCPGNKPILARGAVHLLYEFPTGTKVLPADWRKDKLWKTVQEKMGIENVSPWSQSFVIPE